MDHYSVIHHLYELFFKKVYGDKDFMFKPTTYCTTSVGKFLNLLDKKYNLETIGVNYLCSYMVFQFDYWTGVDIKAYNKKINIRFIFGKKAIDRWLDRNQDYDWTLHQSRFTLKYKINLNEVKSFFKEEEVRSFNMFEEVVKKLHYNTVRGFLHCVDNTTLYNHHSPLCITCKNKVDCKKLLSSNYRQIYKVRGYE